MFITHLTESITDGTAVHIRRSAVDDEDQVVTAIRRLDGRTRSQLVLEGPAETAMIIGGGPEMFVATVVMDTDAEIHELMRDNSRDGESEPPVELVTGGQSGLFAAEHVVDIATLIAAATAFASVGRPAAALRWRRE